MPLAPDYADPDSWAALPARDSRGGPGERSGSPAAVFFVHPTTYFGRRHWNGPVDGRLTALWTRFALAGQASAFLDAGRLHAPRYRQMALAGFDHPQIREQALDLAYSDVRRAFLHFIDHEAEERPLVLAGHSQGSRHLLRLLDEFFRDETLRARLVAAYVVGARVGSGPFERGEAPVPVCEHPDQTGCLLAWRTFAEGADPSHDSHGELVDGETVCVNPLTWRRDPVPAPASANRGSISLLTLRPPRRIRPGLTGARCADGVLWITPPPGLGFRFAHGRGNWHAYDYALFWENVRQNARHRVRVHRATTPLPSS